MKQNRHAENGRLPFSRPFPVERLHHRDEVEIDVEADAKERADLAALDGLVRVDRLSGHFRLIPEGQGVHVLGEVSAMVVQTCIVSLDPIEAEVREEVDMHFAPEAEVAAAEAAAAARTAEDGSLEIDDIPDPPDPIINGQIDLGALTAEFLALGIDPYPRKPGAELDLAVVEGNESGKVASPFAALQKLKQSKD